MDLDSQPEECFLEELDTPYPEIQIQVTEGVPRGHNLSAYIGYIIRMKSPTHLTVQRRYSEFSALREVLVQRWPGIALPCLPSKHASGSNSLRVVNERVKYLSYFLNNCVRLTYIFMSDEFQLFLTSTDPDLKTRLEKLPPLPYNFMLKRYRQAFPGVVVEESQRGQVVIGLRDQVQPFRKVLESQRIALLGLKRQVFKLALRRQDYLKTTRILFCDTLPNLQTYLSRSASQLSPILQTPPVKEAVLELKQVLSCQNYWVLFECLKLQLGEAQSAIDAVRSRQDLQRQEQRLGHDIQVNQQQILAIQAGKMTLKQFFHKNKQLLGAQLQQANNQLRLELDALRELNLMVGQITVQMLAEGYRRRREVLWRLAWSQWVKKEEDLGQFLKKFYGVFLKS